MFIGYHRSGFRRQSERDGTAPTWDSTIDRPSGAATGFQIEVWADNWSAVYIDGEPIGEDSVPITTERSFNAETYTFDAQMPFTVSIEAKDFKETDSGIEYIGEPNQQMGDGGIIAQITDLSTGEVVAVTDADWQSLVVHQAPLNTECADDPDPDETCEFATVDIPADWTSAEFDDSAWVAATEWSAADVGPKEGYEEVTWDSSARAHLGDRPRGRQHHPAAHDGLVNAGRREPVCASVRPSRRHHGSRTGRA